MTAPSAPVTVNRAGEVRVHGRYHGWVDHYDPRQGRTVKTWRWVRIGGAYSPTWFRTRAQAVADLAGQP